MELGILILIILGSFIFKKAKPTEESQGKPIPSKDMTWEEMEEYYGITLSRDSEESEVPEVPVQVPADVIMRNTSESAVSTGNPVDADMYKKPVYSDMYERPVYSGTYDTEARRAAVHDGVEMTQKETARTSMKDIQDMAPSHYSSSRKESLRAAARHGMIWSMILEAPKGARMVGRYHR